MVLRQVSRTVNYLLNKLLLLVSMLVLVLATLSSQSQAYGWPAISGIVLKGQPILVLDHATDKQGNFNIPDAQVNAWKEADGTVDLLIPHFENYRLRGPALEQLKVDQHVIFSSSAQAGDLIEDHYNYRHWLLAPYTLDGIHVYALSHTEWYACLLVNDCHPGRYKLGSWTTTNNSFKSDDGGKTWIPNGVNNKHLVFDGSNHWTGSSALKARVYRRWINHSGFVTPSRLIKEGDYYYTVGIEIYRDFRRLDVKSGRAPVVKYGFGILRTRDISKPSGWETWDGSSYKAALVENMKVFVPQERGAGVNMGEPQMIYDLNSKQFVLMFASRTDWHGIYYMTTRSLASPAWSEARRVVGSDEFHPDPRSDAAGKPCNTGFVPMNYPSVIDGSSPGLNFEFTGGTPWLFYVVNPARCGGRNLDRDLYRVRLRFTYH